LKRAVFILSFLGTLLLITGVAQAQTEVDLAFGVSGVHGTSFDNADLSGGFFGQDVGGGAFPTFSGDFIFHRHLGVMGEVSWRATQNLSQSIAPFRPIFYDFGVIWAPPLGKHAAAELTTGIGGESIRFYTGTINCSFISCTDYVSSNHFLWALGGGVRLYAWRNLFIRPELKYYLVHDNFEFSSNHALRIGASIGYTFGRQ
jgi:hypothetical protein